MTDKNNNEKFLLDLLSRTDVVYNSGTDEFLYFYPSKPESLGFEIKIPYNQASTSVDVNFVVAAASRRDSEEKVVNFSLGSVDNVKEFMAELYKKHDSLLNNRDIPEHVLAKFEEVLKAPLDKYPFFVEGKEENLCIRTNQHNEEGVYISLGRTLYNYENKVKFKPLAPITIKCFYKDDTTNGNIMYEKVIPAYLVNEYPIVAKHAYVSKSVKEIHSLADALYELSPKSASVVGTMVLDIELENKDSVKNSRPKL